MTNLDFKKACKALGWKYADAADALGKSVGTIKLYATKGSIPEDVVEKLSSFELGDTPKLPPLPKTGPENETSVLLKKINDQQNQIAGLQKEILCLKAAKPSCCPRRDTSKTTKPRSLEGFAQSFFAKK